MGGATDTYRGEDIPRLVGEDREMSTTVDEAPRSGSTAPAVNAPTWSGRKTAVAAAVAIGPTSPGAVAAGAPPAGSGASRQGSSSSGSTGRTP